MFLCEKCHKIGGGKYPHPHRFKSHGTCERCKREADCYDSHDYDFSEVPPGVLGLGDMTPEQRKNAWNNYQAQRDKQKLYNAIRRKAIRRAYALLRKKHSSEYQAFLNRETEELLQQYKRKGGVT